MAFQLRRRIFTSGCLLSCLSLAGCPTSPSTTDATVMDSSPVTPPVTVLVNGPANAMCDNVTLFFDVQAPTSMDPAAHVPGLGPSDFMFTQIDADHETEQMVTSSCTMELSAEAGLPGYQACFTGLTPLTNYFFRVTASVQNVQTSTTIFVATPACVDAGDGASVDTGADAVADVEMDAGMDAGMDAETDAAEASVDAGMDAALDVEQDSPDTGE